MCDLPLSRYGRAMGDYEGTPSKWDWSPSIAGSVLKTKLSNTDSRLISVHRPDGGATVPFTAVWIANKGADKTVWDWNPGTTGAHLDSLVKKAQGRLIHIDAFIVTAKGVQFAGVWVKNTGSFKRDWGWDPALTSAQLTTKVGRSQRIISLTTYVQNGQRLYAAVWVRNTGAEHRHWSWTPGATFEQLRQKLEDLPGRLVSIDSFKAGNDTHFAAAWVDAEDAFAKLWWWGVGQSADEIKMDIPLYCSYMVEARTLPASADDFAHFRHGFPRGDYRESAALVALSGTAAVSDVKTDVNGYFEQDSSLDLHLKSIAPGAVDIVAAELIRTYHGWFWPDRVTKMLDPGEIFSGKPAQMAAGADYQGTRPDSEWGLTHYIARVRATDSGGAAQRTALAIPIQRSGFAAVAPTEATVPVWLGMWANPADIIPLSKDGKTVHWLVLGGEIVNWTGETLRVAGLHVTVLTPGGTIVADRECNYDFRKHDYDNNWPPVPPSTIAHAELPDPYTVFVDGMEIPAKVDVSAGLTIRLVLNYKLPDGWCGSTARIDHASYLETPPMLSPVRTDADGTWHFGNGMTQIGFSPHAHFHERFSYDLTQHDATNSTTKPGQDENDNNSFYCYGKEVHAMVDGVVLGCYFMAPENHGRTTDGGDAWNYVILGHDAKPVYPRRTRYVHLQPKAPDSPSNPSHPLAAGDSVSAGDVIGFVGNSGHSSEPHLHFDLWGIDPSGHPRPWPMRFSDLRPAGSKRSAPGTPTTGDYETT